MADSRGFGEFAFDRCVVQAQSRRLLIDDRPVVVGARAFDLLLALVERRGQVVGKSELLQIVWPNLIVEENNLQVQVSALRKLLGAETIATVRGRGYRFTAELAGAADGDTWAAAVVAQPGAPPTLLSPRAAPSIARGSANESTIDSSPAASPASSPGGDSSFAPPSNLPLRPLPLIGRDGEHDALVELILTQRLVTIVGAAGLGKTVLALAVASALRERWRDGAWIVELATIGEPPRLPQAVAQALRIPLGAGDDPLDHLIAALRSQSMLLVLDNCEHVVEAAAALAEAIAARAPGIRLLATSRQRLNVPGEEPFMLGPLAVPAPDQSPSTEQFSALRLFAERAHAVDAQFTLDPANLAAVADICRQLDGLPLAIELAAARVRLLGVDGVLKRLDARFRLLTGGPRSAPPHHQTLQSAIDWSHELLAPREQVLLRRLGVFVGGFSLALAQQVAGDALLDPWQVLDALGVLVDRSLVAVDAAEPRRYRLLETTRAYALDRLAQAGETRAWLQRHAHAVRDMFVETEEQRFGEQGRLDLAAFLAQLEPELDNARAAFEWAAGPDGDRPTAVALAAAAGAVCGLLGLGSEAADRFRRTANWVDGAADADPDLAALYWLNLGMLGDVGRLPKEAVLDALARALDLYRARGARRRQHACLSAITWARSRTGDTAAGADALSTAELLERPSDPVWVRNRRLHVQAFILSYQERFADSVRTLREQRAILQQVPSEERTLIECETNLCRDLLCLRHYQEALEICLEVLERTAGRRMSQTGYLLLIQLEARIQLGQTGDAEHTLREALPVWRRDALLGYAMLSAAPLLAARQRWAEAARVEAAGLAFARSSGVVHHTAIRNTDERLRQLVADAGIDAADLERWRREGESLDEDAVAAILLGAPPPAADHS